VSIVLLLVANVAFDSAIFCLGGWLFDTVGFFESTGFLF